MIRIYISPSCSSCRKVIKWFDEQKIPYVQINIFVRPLTEDELKDILSKTENGTEDIISTRSKILKENNIDIDSMTLKELLKFIQDNPSVLKRPIIVDDTKIQVGYNSDEIRAFIPHARRIAEWACQHNECPTFESCDYAKNSRD